VERRRRGAIRDGGGEATHAIEELLVCGTELERNVRAAACVHVSAVSSVHVSASEAAAAATAAAAAATAAALAMSFVTGREALKIKEVPAA
jgi:hypothetical protein